MTRITMKNNFLAKNKKWLKRSIAFLSDVWFTYFCWLGTGWLSSTPFLKANTSILLLATLTLAQSLVYLFCGLYRGVWRFASIPDLIRIIKSVFIGSGLSFFFLELNHVYLPVQTYVINIMLLLLILSGSRLLFRWLRDYKTYQLQGKRTLIVGAGNAGESLIRDLRRSQLAHQYQPVAIVDDDKAKHGCEVRGVRILGACKNIPKLVQKNNIELIFIAIPSADSKRMREIVRYCEESKLPFRTLPGLKHIADGNVSVNALREVLIDDLLGREQVNLDWQAISASIQNKTILVTGGGGSIGAELCRQIIQLSPKKLIILDNNEFNLYSIDMELKAKFKQAPIDVHLCNVTDYIDVELLFKTYKPELVFHVAAYKHVPLLETHIRAAIYNNIIGTKTIAEAAERHQVTSFVLISTDKAVNPSSIMGATKRASELFCQMLNQRSSVRFITVRFGNVLDSAGSVVPLFRSQLLKGGPLTVTHPDITRYFMTIPEASQLILQANTMENQGDIFVLDMGEPIKINYLAEQMIKLSGKVVGHDIDIIYTGLRPGEKLYEELFHEAENLCETSHPKIKQAKIRSIDWPSLLEILQNMEAAYKNYDDLGLKNLLCELVPEYQKGENPKPLAADKIDPDETLSGMAKKVTPAYLSPLEENLN